MRAEFTLASPPAKMSEEKYADSQINKYIYSILDSQILCDLKYVAKKI